MEFSKEKVRILTLGALLHDIGKIAQRAFGSSKPHSFQGYSFLKGLPSDDMKIAALFAKYHHVKDLEREGELKKDIREVADILGNYGISEEEIVRMLNIVCDADTYSAKEREEGTPTGRTRLMCPFTCEGINPNSRRLYYEVMPLDVFLLPIPKEECEASQEEYRRLLNAMRSDLRILVESQPRVDPYNLLIVLEKYTSFVSSYTTENNYISLYDHLRTTAAIASSLYLGDGKHVLVVGGDFSGIQSFIYGIRGGKGSLKYLRARSAYLTLLSYDICLEIIGRLNLSPANILFNGGGNFILILPSSEEAKRVLEEVRSYACEWIWRNLRGLYFALEWVEVEVERLGREFGSILNDLRGKLGIKKLRRFEEILEKIGERNEEERDPERLEECKICGKEVKKEELSKVKEEEEEIEVCKLCKELHSLGSMLPKCLGFWRSSPEGSSPNALSAPFSRFYIVYGSLWNEVERERTLGTIRGLARGPGILLLKIDWRAREKKDFMKSLREIIWKVPDISVMPLLSADYAKMVGNSVITFEKLAENSKGYKRVGVLRADVDDLGYLFSKAETPSQMATISRMLDYFFKAFLVSVILGETPEGIPEDLPRILEQREGEPNIVVVYSGGDDLFLVGSWNEVFELAFRVREAFRAYVGGDKPSLSASLGYFQYKHPVYYMAEETGRRLDLAKEEAPEKDRIYVISRGKSGSWPPGFCESYNWDRYTELWKKYAEKIYDPVRGKLREKGISKSILWKILALRERYLRDPLKDLSWSYMMYYYLSRAKLYDLIDLAKIDLRNLKAPQEIFWIDGVLKIVLMAVRR